MSNEERDRLDKPDEHSGEEMNFIQEFIERKKLQNKILGEIINKINLASHPNGSKPDDKSGKP